MKSSSAAALALLLCAPLPGCLAVAAGGAAAIGYVQYTKNEAYRDFEVELEDAWDASLAALQTMNYGVSTSAPLGPTEGEVEVGDVWLRAETHPEGFVRVRVRVGTFKTDDHQRRAKLILNEIERRLESS